MVWSAREGEIFELLKELPLFNGMESETLKIFASCAAVRFFPKGKIIYVEEEKAECFYIVQKGWIKLFRETFDGAEAIIDILSDCHVFGELTIFDECIYSSSAEAVEDSIVIYLPTVLLKEHVNQNQKLALNMLRAISCRQKQQYKIIEHLAVQNASQRIGCFLLRLCPKQKEHDIVIQLPYDKILLASRLGMQPETFSRALNTLRKKTGLRIKGARVEIDNIKKIISFVCCSCSSAYPCED
jgi:CRP-like cAMP-binding protein